MGAIPSLPEGAAHTLAQLPFACTLLAEGPSSQPACGVQT